MMDNNHNDGSIDHGVVFINRLILCMLDLFWYFRPSNLLLRYNLAQVHYYMDSSEKFVRLSSNLLECCEIFNSLFGEIVLIRNSSVDGVLSESILPAREIDESLLSADQKHAIKQVAGLLMDISQVVSCDNSYSSDIASLHEILTRQTLMERKHKRTIAALQDYLALELTRSEELESKLKAKETELVSVSEERNKYVRLSQQVTSSGSQSQSSKSSILPSKTKGEEKEPFNPKDWIGRYIRKSFGTSYYFGAVASFDPPYFKVS